MFDYSVIIRRRFHHINKILIIKFPKIEAKNMFNTATINKNCKILTLAIIIKFGSRLFCCCFFQEWNLKSF